MTSEERKIYEAALDKWGVLDQLFMLFEEVSELLNAVCKARRGRVQKEDIITELADVQIMLEQVTLIFNAEEEVGEEKKRKLERLKERLEK